MKDTVNIHVDVNATSCMDCPFLGWDGEFGYDYCHKNPTVHFASPSTKYEGIPEDCPFRKEKRTDADVCITLSSGEYEEYENGVIGVSPYPSVCPGAGEVVKVFFQKNLESGHGHSYTERLYTVDSVSSTNEKLILRPY